jgi:hypothetical protein
MYNMVCSRIRIQVVVHKIDKQLASILHIHLSRNSPIYVPKEMYELKYTKTKHSTQPANHKVNSHTNDCVAQQTARE